MGHRSDYVPVLAVRDLYQRVNFWQFLENDYVFTNYHHRWDVKPSEGHHLVPSIATIKWQLFGQMQGSSSRTPRVAVKESYPNVSTLITLYYMFNTFLPNFTKFKLLKPLETYHGSEAAILQFPDVVVVFWHFGSNTS